jgi:hypothetical protein
MTIATRLAGTMLFLVALAPARADLFNLRVVTDASPDYTDMAGMIHSITSKWPTDEEKVRAMFYWNHIARRQTSPMILHGTALTDPIRQFNDYGYTMCSTISGINCSIWDAMGLKAKYWDISNHTVAEVQFRGGWHMIDNSLSAIYTLCDGKTLAGVQDIGAVGACAASGGKSEPGHIAKYHCLNATSKNGFLTGSDTIRSLDEEYRCFNPNGLKYRTYFYDWDRGHRYILNLRQNEVYTRHYASLGDTPDYYVPNNGKDPEDPRFRIRGNGERVWKPDLRPELIKRQAYSLRDVAADPTGLRPTSQGKSGEVIFKVEGANVITSLRILTSIETPAKDDTAAVAVSTTNGMSWREVCRNGDRLQDSIDLKLVDEVNGAYEVLVRVTMAGKSAVLKSIEFRATTMLNSKTQPKLLLGKNTIWVGVGDQTESVVLWPDLRGKNAQPYIVEQKNVTFQQENPGFMGTLHATRPNEEAYVVFRVDAPREISRLQYGGRLYNRAPKGHIEFLHSFDGGKSWQKSYSLTDTSQPWDVIRYETIDKIPAGTKSVLCKYLLNASEAGPNACSIYAVRMEAHYRPAPLVKDPVEVTFRWSERAADNSLVERSHTELVSSYPSRYTINVGGVDHPVVHSLRVNLKGAVPDARNGYSDGKDAGGGRTLHTSATYGRNLAEGKSYSVSIPSETMWEAGDEDGRKLTDGVVGPIYSGGTSYRTGAIWSPNKNPTITVDLGENRSCASFGLNAHGYPAQDALKGEIEDTFDVLVSDDGRDFRPVGRLKTALRRKDIPINYLLPDTEELMGATLRFIPDRPFTTRYVRFQIANKRHLCVTEIEVLDSIRFEPYDLRIALPDEP